MPNETNKSSKPASSRQIAERFSMTDADSSRVLMFYEMSVAIHPEQTRAAIENALAALDHDSYWGMLISASLPMDKVSYHESQCPIDENGEAWRCSVQQTIEDHEIDLVLPWWERTDNEEYPEVVNTHLSGADYLLEQFKFMQIAYELMQPHEVERRQRVTNEYKEAMQAIEAMEQRGLLDGNGYPRCDLDLEGR